MERKKKILAFLRASSNIQLKRLKPSPNSSTTRTLPPRPLLCHKHIHTRLADPTNALGARIALLQQAHALTRRAIDLYTLRREAGRRIREAPIVNVEHVPALSALDGGKGFRCVGHVGGRGEGLLEGRGLVALKVGC